MAKRAGANGARFGIVTGARAKSIYPDENAIQGGAARSPSTGEAVERRVPAVVHRPASSKQRRYQISGPYLRDCYCFTATNRTALKRGLTRQAWANI